MASRTSSVCTASAPFGPRKKGEEARVHGVRHERRRDCAERGGPAGTSGDQGHWQDPAGSAGRGDNQRTNART
eukprot:scaffold127505_cov90-Phaeocystis_antarctica.AAC.1